MNVEQGITWYLDARYGAMRPASWAKHRMTLNLFGKAFAGRDLDELTKQDLREWRDSLNLKPSSANKYMDRIKALYTHLGREDLAAKNPAAGVDRLDEPSVRRVRLPGEALGAMMASARHPRDRALIAVSIELLLRGSEVAELRVSDVQPGALRVLVSKQKGELAEDEMAISSELAAVLADWLRVYRRTAGILLPDSYLFPRIVWRKSGLGGDYALHPQEKIGHPEEVVKLALKAAGYDVPPGTGVHAIRRTCARLLFDHLVRLENGDRAMSHVSSLMHHSSRRTTELYLGTTGDRVMRNEMVRTGGATPLSLAMAKVDKTNQSHLSEGNVYALTVRSV